MKIDDLIKEYKNNRNNELAMMDCFASAMSVNSIFRDRGVDFSSITPQMKEAFHLQFPTLKISDLNNYTKEQLEGIKNGWKGKLFEINLRDGLNKGENIGGIHLTNGESAHLVSNPTNPGFDLVITDHSGHVVDELQAKATNSISYIHEAIKKYPNYDIITTEETANDLGSHFKHVSQINGVNIHDSGISNNELTERLNNTLHHHSIDIFAFTFLIVPLVINGKKYLAGKYTTVIAVNKFVEDATKSSIAIAGGSLVALLGLGTGIGTLAAFAIRYAIRNSMKKDDQLWGDLEKYSEVNDKDIWPDLNKFDNVNDRDIWD